MNECPPSTEAEFCVGCSSWLCCDLLTGLCVACRYERVDQLQGMTISRTTEVA